MITLAFYSTCLLYWLLNPEMILHIEIIFKLQLDLAAGCNRAFNPIGTGALFEKTEEKSNNTIGKKREIKSTRYHCLPERSPINNNNNA